MTNTVPNHHRAAPAERTRPVQDITRTNITDRVVTDTPSRWDADVDAAFTAGRISMRYADRIMAARAARAKA